MERRKQPRKLENSLASLSGTAKKSYNNKNTRAAIAAYLLPQAAQMPSREPDEMPAMASLAEYARPGWARRWASPPSRRKAVCAA